MLSPGARRGVLHYLNTFISHRSFGDLGLDGAPQPQIEAMIGQGADLGVLAVVANAHNGHAGFFDHRNELLYAPSVFVPAHAVDL